MPSQKKQPAFQFSVGSLLMVTLAVAVWISGLRHLSQDHPVYQQIHFAVAVFAVLGMTMAALAGVFVVYGTLLMMVFCADFRAEQQCRSFLKSWLRLVLIATVAFAPWLVALAHS